MIRFIRGRLKHQSQRDRRIVVFVGNDGNPNSAVGIGYEIDVPASTNRSLSSKKDDEPVDLYVSYQQSQNQPVPRLYGFARELERDFFEELIRVSDVGPSTALTAMSSVPVCQIAKAIVDRDVKMLRSLEGIGEKTAEKIIAELRSRASKYALLPEDAASVSDEPADFKAEVREALVKQLQFKPLEAQKAIEDAIKRNPKIASPEDLFDEVLRGQK